MKKTWLKACAEFASMPCDFYASNRKIIRNESIVFTKWKNDLTLRDIGYTSAKLKRLVKDYIHEESRDKAIELWDHFKQRNSYASTSFHTYNHLVKAGATSPSESKETRGPCLQSVIITLLPKRTAGIDVFYRTTELFKKFPADLLLLDELLKPFDFKDTPIVSRTFHFANVTCHPMYTIVPAALADEPWEFFEAIKKTDPKFFKICITWMHRYLCDNTGIKKYQQALRTQFCGIELLEEKGTIKKLTKYIREQKNALQ